MFKRASNYSLTQAERRRLRVDSSTTIAVEYKSQWNCKCKLNQQIDHIPFRRAREARAKVAPLVTKTSAGCRLKPKAFSIRKIVTPQNRVCHSKINTNNL